ncbi:hypothetical protein D3C87_1915910 [compost metagenome]
MHRLRQPSGQPLGIRGFGKPAPLGIVIRLALVQNARPVHRIQAPCPRREQQTADRNARCPDANHDNPAILYPLPDHLQRIQKTGQSYNCRPMLIVMKHGNI